MKSGTILAGITALAALASPAIASSSSPIPKRPSLKASPYNPGQPQPYSPPRDKHRRCHVPAGCSPKDDAAPRILKAFKKCNNGGTVVLDKDYLISSPLDLTFLRHVDVVITGEVHFDDSDVYYWAEESFKYPFQNTSSFLRVGGEDVNIYGDLSNGKSLIDGHGQAYWKEIETNSTLKRPLLWVLDGLKGGTMSNLRMENPPFVSLPVVFSVTINQLTWTQVVQHHRQQLRHSHQQHGAERQGKKPNTRCFYLRTHIRLGPRRCDHRQFGRLGYVPLRPHSHPGLPH